MKMAVLAMASILAITVSTAGAETTLSDYDKTRQDVAKQMVDKAIAAFALDPDGALAQIQDINNRLYHDGELYVVIMDESSTIVGHGVTPDLVGVNNYEIIDSQGTNLGELLDANRSPYGKWIEYWWTNPATETQESELKLTWVKTHGKYQFGVGTYPGSGPTVDFAGIDGQTIRLVQEMADTAIEAFAADADSAMDAIQNPEYGPYHDGELYVFVIDGNKTMVAHGVTPDLVGTNLHTLYDVQGTNLGELFEANTSPYGRWVEYWWPNPAAETDEPERKVVWLKASSGYGFGVGTYPDAEQNTEWSISMNDKERRGVAWQMVQNAAEAFHADPETAMAAIEDTENRLYHDGGLYVSIINDQGVIVSHGATPSLIGTSLYTLNDTHGNNLGELFDVSRSPYGKWIEYWWTNPATETQDPERKITLVLEKGEYVFAAGTYPEMGDTRDASDLDSEKQRIAKAMVERAIEAFTADAESAMSAVADTANPLYHDGELYVFVVDGNRTMVAHGVTPDLVGTNLHTLYDVQGTNLGELFEANTSPYGRWVEYWWPNPATETDEPERKVTWIKSSSGHTLAVGFYP